MATATSIFEEQSPDPATNDKSDQPQVKDPTPTTSTIINPSQPSPKPSPPLSSKPKQTNNKVNNIIIDNNNNNDNKNNNDDDKDNDNDDEKFPPNSINLAKKKYLLHKERDAHKYPGGSPKARRSSFTDKLTSQITDKLTSSIDEYKDTINSTISSTLNVGDKYVSALSQSTGIKFAPVNIPLKRRRQTFAVLIYSLMYLFFILINFIAFRYWTGIKFYLYILYLFWKLFYQTFHRDGGLPIPWLRNAFFWKWFVDFFPIHLHATYNLDDTGNTSYIFGYHPHGIIGMGAVGTFATMASGFHKLFPSVDVRLLTLRINFFIPFFDLYCTFMGICDASRESCNAILSDPENKSLCLVLGGAKESLEANPGIVQLFLKNRKGFVKVALENGASLVPVFGFGENELFSQIDNPQGSFVRKLQNSFQKRLGFAIPLFYGRGVFQYNYGLLPRRQPINVVFGKPISCPKLDRSQITPELINKYHTVYCNELKALFDANKSKYYDSKEIPQLHFI